MHGKDPHSRGPIRYGNFDPKTPEALFHDPRRLGALRASAFYSVNFHWQRVSTPPALTADMRRDPTAAPKGGAR